MEVKALQHTASPPAGIDKAPKRHVAEAHDAPAKASAPTQLDPQKLAEMLQKVAESRGHAPAQHSGIPTKLELAIDDATGRVVGRILDRHSGELLSQIPSEEMLRLIAATEELLGPLLDVTT